MPNPSTVPEINEQNKSILQSLASTQEGFTKLLDTLAAHTAMRRRDNNLSVLSCAALAVSGYGDTREAMTVDDWSKIDPSIHPREGAAGIPVVKASSTGKHFRADNIYPAEAMEGIPEDYYHGYASRIDLKDDVDRAAFYKALGELALPNRATGAVEPVDFNEIDPNAQYLVYKHFGMDVPEKVEVVPPTPEVLGDVKALKAYCDSIKSQAGRIMSQIQEVYTSEIKAYEGVEQDQQQVKERELPSIADEPKASESPQRPYVPAGNSPLDNAQAATIAAAGTVQPKPQMQGSIAQG